MAIQNLTAYAASMVAGGQNLRDFQPILVDIFHPPEDRWIDNDILLADNGRGGANSSPIPSDNAQSGGRR